MPLPSVVTICLSSLHLKIYNSIYHLYSPLIQQLYKSGSHCRSHIYQSNFHDIRQISAPGMICSGSHWTYLALLPALTPSYNVCQCTCTVLESVRFNYLQKILRGCEGYCIQKWLSSSLPMWTATIGAHLSHVGEPGAHTHIHGHTVHGGMLRQGKWLVIPNTRA